MFPFLACRRHNTSVHDQQAFTNRFCLKDWYTLRKCGPGWQSMAPWQMTHPHSPLSGHHSILSTQGLHHQSFLFPLTTPWCHEALGCSETGQKEDLKASVPVWFDFFVFETFYSPGWPWNHSAVQVRLELLALLLSQPPMKYWGLQALPTISWYLDGLMSPIISSLKTWSLKEPILGCWPASLRGLPVSNPLQLWGYRHMQPCPTFKRLFV